MKLLLKNCIRRRRMKKYLEKKINKLIKETYDKEIELLKRELILNMKLNEEEKKRKEYYERRNI